MNNINKLIENSDTFYDVESMQAIIDDYHSKHSLADIDLENSHWVLHQELIDGRINIDFQQIKKYIIFLTERAYKDFEMSVKYWFLNQLKINTSKSVADAFRGLVNFFRITQGLTNFDIEIGYEKLIEDAKYKIKDTLWAGYTFLSEYEIYEMDDAFEYIFELGERFKSNEEFSRNLPSNKDIIVFSRVVDDYFSRDLSDLEYLRWFPVWLWWKLTTIIPMRPSEFCLLRKDALKEVENGYELTIDRVKTPKSKKFVQSLKIPKFIAAEIIKYKGKINYSKDEKLLISYKNLPIYDTANNRLLLSNYRAANKLVSIFNRSVFKKLLDSFYRNIIDLEYKLYDPINHSSSVIKRILLPGDTRHLAFINMKRQGIDPVLIAKIGGHKKLISQEHYFRHLNNFVDLKIMEVLIGDNIQPLFGENKFDDTIGLDFINTYIVRPVNSNYKRQLRIGFCTDINQDCKVNKCFYCNDWRISEEEYINKKGLIISEIKNIKNELDGLIENLKDVYSSIYREIGGKSLEKVKYIENPELKKVRNLIDGVIEKYIDLLKVEEKVIKNE